MCDEKNKCEEPENLETKPEECTPEKVEECHGDVKEHPCVEEEKNEWRNDRSVRTGCVPKFDRSYHVNSPDAQCVYDNSPPGSGAVMVRNRRFRYGEIEDSAKVKRTLRSITER